MAECDDRTQRRVVRGLNAGGFPRPKRLPDFDIGADPPSTRSPCTSSRRVTGSVTAGRCVYRGLGHR